MSYELLTAERPAIGILGASRIVQSALLDAAGGLVRVAAVAARDLSRAQSYARDHGIPRAYGSYEELIADPEIDLIYNALPASGHAPWSMQALRAGKHVLCEKPFGLHVDEAKECVATAKAHRRLLMEAHHWRYHPLAADAEQQFRELGKLRQPLTIEAQFHASLDNPGDIRLNPALGPGALMDFGCYTIQWCVFAAQCVSAGMTGTGLEDVGATIASSDVVEGEPGVDWAARVGMNFSALPSGPLGASFSCDMRCGTPFRAFVRVRAGDREVLWENPLDVKGSWLTVSQAGEELSRREPRGPTTYGGQLRAFLQALRSGEPPINSCEKIVSTQQLLDDCYSIGGCIGRRELRERALASRLSAAR